MSQHVSHASAPEGQDFESVSHSSLPFLQSGQDCSDLPVDDAFPVPAWFVDQRSWIQDPWKSSSAVFNVPLLLRIRGPLNRDALMSALHQVQQRQQVLRSVFRFVNDQLTQIVLPQALVAAQFTDLSGGTGLQAEARLRDLVCGEASRPFDLAHEPGLRAHIFRLEADEHALLLITHHLVCDDWSTGILFSDIFTLYQGLLLGQSSPLPELRGFQYGDFIRWHEKQLDTKGLASRLSFWKSLLADRSDFHHLTPDYDRPTQRTYRGARETEILPEALTTSLRDLSQRERVSVFMTMLAAFQCLLHRRSGEYDIALGTCAANRPLSKVEPLVGRFANDLVVRTSLAGNPTFRELLGRVRKEALTAYSYQDLPFAKLLEEIEVRPDPRRNPLFQVMFILQDAPKQTLERPGLALEWIPLDMETAKYDLSVWLSFRPGLEISLEYNMDLFAPRTVRQLSDQYRNILEAMVRNPEERVTDTSIAGKHARTNIQGASVTQQTVTPWKDDIESQLLLIWRSGFVRQSIDVQDDFFELGGDSLLGARLFAQIEARFNLKIPLVTLIEAPTIEKLAQIIRNTGSQESMSSVIPIQPLGSRPPLFCAHGQSGNLLIYRSLAQHIGTDQPVYGLQPQGLDGRASPLTRVEDMAVKYAKEIRQVQPTGPYCLAGYCMGGAIAFEMAQQLRSQGQAIGLLALLDTYNVGKMQRSWADDWRFRIETLLFGWKHFWLTNSRDKMSFVQRRLDDLRNGDSELEKCNEVAALNYVPTPYEGKLLHVRPTHLHSRYVRPELGWNNLAAGGVETFLLPMCSGQMFEEPFVRDLAAKLSACIDEVVAKQTSRQASTSQPRHDFEEGLGRVS